MRRLTTILMAVALIAMAAPASAEECEADGEIGFLQAEICYTPTTYAEMFSIENVIAAIDAQRGLYPAGEDEAIAWLLSEVEVNPLLRPTGVNREGPTVSEVLFQGRIQTMVDAGRAM